MKKNNSGRVPIERHARPARRARRQAGPLRLRPAWTRSKKEISRALPSNLNLFHVEVVDEFSLLIENHHVGLDEGSRNPDNVWILILRLLRGRRKAHVQTVVDEHVCPFGHRATTTESKSRRYQGFDFPRPDRRDGFR